MYFEGSTGWWLPMVHLSCLHKNNCFCTNAVEPGCFNHVLPAHYILGRAAAKLHWTFAPARCLSLGLALSVCSMARMQNVAVAKVRVTHILRYPRKTLALQRSAHVPHAETKSQRVSQSIPNAVSFCVLYLYCRYSTATFACFTNLCPIVKIFFFECKNQRYWLLCVSLVSVKLPCRSNVELWEDDV